MKTYEAKNLALKLMEKYEIKREGWKFAFNNRKRGLGLCSHIKRTIYLSKVYVQYNNEEEIKNTILHEIAHVLAGPLEGHSSIWRGIALNIGCNGKRLNSTATMPKGKYEYVCKNCGYISYSHRKLKRKYSCLECKKFCPNQYDRELILKYEIVN